jgi:hypothetical protein
MKTWQARKGGRAMKRAFISWSRVGGLTAIVLLVLMTPRPVAAEEGCRTGAEALGNAYVRLNMLYELFYGDVESYVQSNREHFVAGGDTIRCANALAQALVNEALQSYDPLAARDAIRTQEIVNVELGKLGISGSFVPRTLSPAEQLYGLALRFDRLARVLPSVAEGDCRPLYTPTNVIENAEIQGRQMLKMLLQDPQVAWAFQQQEALIKKLANDEYQMSLRLAAVLANR